MDTTTSNECRQERGRMHSPQQYTSSPKPFAFPLFKTYFIVVFDGTSPTFISQTLRDGTPQVQMYFISIFTSMSRSSRLSVPCFWNRKSAHYSHLSQNSYSQLSHQTHVPRFGHPKKKRTCLAKNKISKYPQYLISLQHSFYLPSTSTRNTAGTPYRLIRIISFTKFNAQFFIH